LSSNISIVVKTYWTIFYYLFLFPWFLLVSIAETTKNPCSAIHFHLTVGQINPWRLDLALSCLCSELSGASMLVPSCKWASWVASQSSLCMFGISKSQFLSNRFSVFEVVLGRLCLSVSTGCQSILLIRRTYNTWVCPPGIFFADNAGGKGDFLTM
jgi:hypothetical protein